MFASDLIPASRRRRISLTALIDVVFILLMFFMLTSTFTQWRVVDFTAPVASVDSSVTAPKLLILEADGALHLHDGDWQVSHVDLLDAAAVARLDADASFVLLPKGDVSVQLIVAALEQCQQSGLQRITLGNALPADSTAGIQP